MGFSLLASTAPPMPEIASCESVRDCACYTCILVCDMYVTSSGVVTSNEGNVLGLSRFQE